MIGMQSTTAVTGFTVGPRAHVPAPARHVTTAGWVAVRQGDPMPAGADVRFLCGPACLAVGLGPNGATWLDDLRRSSWFQRLARTPAVLSTAGVKETGRVPAARLALSAGLLPDAPMVAMAIDRNGSSVEHAAGLALVRALRRHRDRNRTRRTVVVTLGHGRADLADRFADAGAFVVEGAPGVPASHLHHFPLRAAIFPAAGRVICADLADHLVTWRPGTCSRLNLLPIEADIAGRHLLRMVQDGRVGAGSRLLNLHVLSVERAANLLTQMDDLWQRSASVLGEHRPASILTNTEPLTNLVGWADLLLTA